MSNRRGFVMAELVIAIILLAIVGGAIHDGLRRQQQLFRSIGLMIGVRADLRDAVEVVAADLSTASPLDTLPLARDSAVELYSTIAASVVCDSAPGYTLRVPPERLQSGLRLTMQLAAPDSGDVLLLYNQDSAATGGTPRWDRHVAAAVATQAAGLSCPAATGFTTSGDVSTQALVISLRSPASVGVRRGAPVRVLRRNRYSLYRSSDSRWYLGNRRCNSGSSGGCGVIQPLSGPYSPYAGGGASGFALTYFDVRGAALSPLAATTAAARVNIVVRARSAPRVQPGGIAARQYADSTTLSVALRNRH